MLLIVFSSSPINSDHFEQGIDVALAGADLELEIEILFEGECAEVLSQASVDSVFVKKLSQLQLYKMPCFCAHQLTVLPCTLLAPEKLREHFTEAHAVLVI